MARLLFCWELGANFGHLSAISSLREDLRAAGFEIWFAVTDLKVAREILGEDAKLLQAPVWPRFNHRGSRIGAASFADVLTLIGFADPGNLAPVTDAWLSLISLVSPDVMVADHSPAAQLAAALSGTKLATIGTSFTMPPLDFPEFPPLRADIAPAVPERTLLAAAAQVFTSRGMPGLPENLPRVFRSDARIVIGLPELDPYRSFRREHLCAPPGGFPKAGQAGPTHLFAYLGAEIPDLPGKIQILCNLPIPVDIYIRGADRQLLEFIRLRGKTAHPKPADVRALLGTATHVVSQGGAMLASEVLSAGRPHLFLPLHLEAQQNADAVVRAGFGRSGNVADSASQFSATLESFLADRDLVERTNNFARIIGDRPLPDAGAELIRALSGLFQGRREVAFDVLESAAPLS